MHEMNIYFQEANFPIFRKIIKLSIRLSDVLDSFTNDILESFTKDESNFYKIKDDFYFKSIAQKFFEIGDEIFTNYMDANADPEYPSILRNPLQRLQNQYEELRDFRNWSKNPLESTDKDTLEKYKDSLLNFQNEVKDFLNKQRL